MPRKHTAAIGLTALLIASVIWGAMSLHGTASITRTKLVLANGFQLSRPDYRIMLWDGIEDARKPPFSVSIPVRVIDYASTGPGTRVWLSRPVIGTAEWPELPASRLTSYLKSFPERHGKAGKEEAIRDMPAELEATVLVGFSPPISEAGAGKLARSDLSERTLYILSNDTTANRFPVTWRIGGDTCANRLLPDCEPASPHGQLRQWLSLLHDEERATLTDLGLQMEGLYKAQREGLVHGLVLNVSGRDRLLNLLSQPQVATLDVVSVVS
jgi:hypothetical protein